jgi:hypothetical protein
MLVSGRTGRLARYLAAMAVVLIIGCTDPGTPPRLGRPRIAPGGGVYTSARTVTLAANEPGARIFYTTDGSDPSEGNGTAYTGPVTVGSNLTLKAVSIMEGWADSPAAVATYRFTASGTATVARPMVSSLGGTFLLAQTVSMSCDTPGATVRYTTDGSTPSATVGAIYTAPIRVGRDTVLKAIAVKSGMTDSEAVSADIRFRPYSWTAPASSPGARSWRAIDISADGGRIAAASGTSGGAVFVIYWDGSPYTETGLSVGNWSSVAISPDGYAIAACKPAEGIRVSSFDPWDSFEEYSSSEPWTALDAPTNNGKFLACANVGGVYLTTDYGASWGPTTAGSGGYTDIASAADCLHLAGCIAAGRVWTTTYPWSTWTEQMDSGIYNWTSICSSSDGQYLAACATSGYIATSPDYGATWHQRDSIRNWTGIACSSDGGTLAACAAGDDIYVSRDYGVTWEAQGAGSLSWKGVAMSADGSRVAACADSQDIQIGY